MLPSGQAGKSLLSLQGKGSRATAKFTVGAQWSVSYAFDCSTAPNSTNFQIFPTDSDPNVILTTINEINEKGSNIQSYTTAGTFYLVINTQCDWKLSVAAAS